VVLKVLGRVCSRRAGHIVGWPRLVTQPPGASARNPPFLPAPRGVIADVPKVPTRQAPRLPVSLGGAPLDRVT